VPAETSRRVIRFIRMAVHQPGVRTQLVTSLGTDYKRLSRFCTLGDGERPIRDMAFLLEILAALGYNAGEVFDAAELSTTCEEMRLLLRKWSDRRAQEQRGPDDRVGERPVAHNLRHIG
jgi:hypothetical protein